MNILIITGSLLGGGTERVSAILANFLNEKGYVVNIAVFHSNYNKIPYDVNKNIKIYTLSNSGINSKKSIIWKLYYSIVNYYLLNKIIVNNNIKTIISFCNLPAILLLLLTKRINVISSKRNFPPASSSMNIFLENQIFRLSKVVVFQTIEQMSFYSNSVQKKGVVIPNPILENLPVAYSEKRKNEIVTFCRLNRQKNLTMLIDGFIKFYENNDDYKLFIYGDYKLFVSGKLSFKMNSYKNELEKYIKERQMEDVIAIKEFSHNIHNLIIDSTCFVLTSDYEGLSNSMLEAMAMGLPVICTDCRGGGAKMFIKNYENGILIPINDREALSRALVYIVANPEKARKMGKKASEIKDTLSQEKICGKWVEILQEKERSVFQIG